VPNISHGKVATHLRRVSQILPPVVSLLPPGLPSRTFARTVSSELLGFLFFLIFFVSVPRARQSWPYRRRLSARKSTVSYHIVLRSLITNRLATTHLLPSRNMIELLQKSVGINDNSTLEPFRCFVPPYIQST